MFFNDSFPDCHQNKQVSAQLAVQLLHFAVKGGVDIHKADHFECTKDNHSIADNLDGLECIIPGNVEATSQLKFIAF